MHYAFSFEDFIYILIILYYYNLIVKHQKIEVKGLETDINIKKDKEICKSERVINVDKELESKYKPLLQSRQDKFMEQQQLQQQQLQQQQQPQSSSQQPLQQQIPLQQQQSVVPLSTSSLLGSASSIKRETKSMTQFHRPSSIRSFKSNKESHRSITSSVVNQLQPVSNGDLTNTIEKQVSIMNKKTYKKFKRNEVGFNTLYQAILSNIGQPLTKDYSKEISSIFNNSNRIYIFVFIFSN